MVREQRIEEIKKSNFSSYNKILKYLRLLDITLNEFYYDEDFTFIVKIFPELYQSFRDYDYECELLKEANFKNPETVKLVSQRAINESHFKDICNQEMKNRIRKLSEVYNVNKQLHYKLKDLLVLKPGNVKKNHPNYLALIKTINNIEKLMSSYLYDFIKAYEGDDDRLLEYLMFDVKSYHFVDIALNRFPYMANFLSEGQNPIIYNLVDHYIEAIDLYTTGYEQNAVDEVLYYKKILDKFMANPKLDYSFMMKRDLLNKVNAFITKISDKPRSSENKNKAVYWSNELCNAIDRKERSISYEELKYQHDVQEEFPYSIKSETRNYSESMNRGKHLNHEVVNDYIVTIDDADAKEIDDGLSIKRLKNGNIILGVHIASPLSYIDEDSIIFDEASDRVTSIYLSDRTIPQYPKRLSSNIMSLEEGKPRLAKSYYLEINEDGKVENFEIKKTVINVSKKLIYDWVNNIFINKEQVDSKLLNTLNGLRQVSDRLAKSVVIDPFYQEAYRKKMNVSNTNLVGGSIAERVVERAMIITGHMTASWFKERDLPFPYRNHKVDSDFEERLTYYQTIFSNEHTKKSAEYHDFVSALINEYPTAYYSNVNLGHQGLNMDCYAHVTSPLRRFADNIAEMCLEKFYFSDSYDEEDIAQMNAVVDNACKKINSRMKTLKMFTTEYEAAKVKKLDSEVDKK